MISDPFDDPTEYRKIVKSLQYMSLTRPDISFLVNKLSRLMSERKVKQWMALKIKNTRVFVRHIDSGDPPSIGH